MEENTENDSETVSEEVVSARPTTQQGSTSAKYSTFIGAAIIASLIAAVLWMQISSESSEVPLAPAQTIAPSVPKLTTEEMDQARLTLDPSEQVLHSSSSMQLGETAVSIAEMEEAKELTPEQAEQAAGAAKPPTPLASSPTTEVDSTDLQFKNATVINTATNGQPVVSRSISGTVFSIDDTNNIITITAPDSAYRVYVESGTIFSIDGMEFDINDLKVADVVVVKGEGTAASKQLIAQTIEVTGTLEIITSVN